MQQGVGRLTVGHQHGARIGAPVERSQQGLANRGKVGRDPVGHKITEQGVRIDRTIVTDLPREIGGLFRQLADALGERGVGFLDLHSLDALGLRLLTKRLRRVAEQPLLLLGHLHGHAERLDALTGLGLLLLQRSELVALTGGLGFALLEVALELGEALLGKGGVTGGGLHLPGEIRRALAGLLQGRGQLGALTLHGGEILFTGGQRGRGRLEL